MLTLQNTQVLSNYTMGSTNNKPNNDNDNADEDEEEDEEEEEAYDINLSDVNTDEPFPTNANTEIPVESLLDNEENNENNDIENNNIANTENTSFYQENPEESSSLQLVDGETEIVHTQPQDHSEEQYSDWVIINDSSKFQDPIFDSLLADLSNDAGLSRKVSFAHERSSHRY